MTSIESMREEMRRAVQYRSGPGLMNEVYLGGMAAAAIMRHLGGVYGGDKSLDQLIVEASDGQLRSAWNYKGFQWILQHYRKNGSKLYDYTIARTERK